jgi:hypothetical protein
MDSVNEQISACLDGELPADQGQLLLKRVARDSQTRETFGRYALVGEVMRNNAVPGLLDGRFAQRVSAQVASEAAGSRTSRLFDGKLRRFAVGFGVAAAVAVLAIRSLTGVSVDTGNTGLSAEATSKAISYTVPEPPDRMTSYLVRHGSNQAGVVRNSSWARVVVGESSPPAPQPGVGVMAMDPDKGPESESPGTQTETGAQKP